MSIRKISKAKLATLALATVSCAGMAATPVSIKYTINRAENVKKNNAMVLPYFFSSDTMGFNLGIGGVVQGIGQDQMAMGATGWGGAESYGFSGGIWNYRPSFSNRTFFSIAGMYATFPSSVPIQETSRHLPQMVSLFRVAVALAKTNLSRVTVFQTGWI
ncbi:hypothetical protein JCM19241_3142 [Vibrio ishigakensis]|uniref:Uncharacterized protein n=1 Tax=Vibrio ishigakensis TaxID=1481914 RepID=A0A0B8Q9Q4_9VIBR|nr:hypothetical protein JCM19241_3142 [Vibrio ishigakensis]